MSVNLSFDDDGICSACRVSESFEKLSPDFWEARKKKFEKVIKGSLKNKKEGDFDCLIPVSGGKDSYYQAHVMCKELGLKPLFVTYHGNNYLPEGDYNRDMMRHVFDADHIVYGPSVQVIKKLNRLTFRKMGDMNWHAHSGISSIPITIAVKFNIPLIIWGETSWDISGMHSPDDYVEFSSRSRHEHDLRGFEWYDLVGDEKEPLVEADFFWAKYPSDEEILESGVRGLFIGNFFKWRPNWHTELVRKEYGWKPFEGEFQRTYRRMSNLDDRYENGVHDLLKFIKFGYGRASDHASKDIRSGEMTREVAIEMVKKYDHVVSDDLDYWLDYVGMSAEEFWVTADSFRDPKVWAIENGKWVKDCVWGARESFGDVNLPSSMWSKYQ
jgi:N-acetyl sugar amidotransferase